MTRDELAVLDVALDHLGERRSTAVPLEWLQSSVSWLSAEEVGVALHRLSARGVLSYVPPLESGLRAIIARPWPARIEASA